MAGNTFFKGVSGHLSVLMNCSGLRKLFSTMTALLVFSQGTPIAAHELNQIQEVQTESVCYDELNDLYVLKNIEAEEVLQAFEKSADFELASLSVNRAGTYIADYYVNGSYAGISGESVPVTWTVNMNMTTVTISNKNYAQFVSIRLGPVVSLGSGSYTIASQSSPSASILNGGSQLSISQILQLQTTTGHSINAGASAGWVSIGAASSGTYYHRGPSRTVSGVYTLPLYNYAG